MEHASSENLFYLRAVVDRFDAKEFLETLAAIGIDHAYSETARSVLLDDNSSIMDMIRKRLPLSETQSAVLSFLVPEGSGRETLNYLTWKLGLDMPGQGSIIARKVQRLGSVAGLRITEPRLGPTEPRIISEELTGITCIVVKGAGNDVATIGLTTGTAVPDLSYGIGTGLRNRLGAWRILIPAEKEVANLVVNSDEAETIIERMITAGRLDQPGQGFIFSYPVDMGVLETKFSTGESGQAASLEQLIYAMDEVKGSTEWRRKGQAAGSHAENDRHFLTSLVDLTMHCNEGFCETLTKAAMDAGASGATMRQLKYVPLAGGNKDLSPAREVSVMTIGAAMVEPVAAALRANGLLEPAVSGEVWASPVTKAFTFLGK